MRGRAAAPLLAIPLIIFDAWGGEAPAPSGDELAVRAVVESYMSHVLDAESTHCPRTQAGPAALDQDPADRGPLARWTAAWDRFRASRAVRNEIAMIDLHGNAGVVKAVLTRPSGTRVAYLSVRKDDQGEWRVVSKVGGAARG